MLKIAMLVWNDLVTDARVVRESQALTEEGHKVVAFSTCRNIQKDAVFSFENIAFDISTTRDPKTGLGVLNLLLVMFSRLGVIYRMLQSIHKKKPDIVHVHDVNMLPVGMILYYFFGYRFVFDAHEISVDREGYRKIKWFILILEKWGFKNSIRAITTTEARAMYFHSEYGVSPPVVIQNRADFYKNEVIPEIDKRDGRFRVIYQGGLQEGRGIRTILEVAARLPEVEFLFVGGGAQSHLVIEGERNQGNVTYIPTVPSCELPKYTVSADVGIQVIRNTCINHYTTDSNKLFEYIQAGIPVIASDFPEIRKVIDSYNVGILVDPTSVNDVANAIIQLKGQNLEEYSNSISAAQRELSWSVESQKLSNLYVEIESNYFK